MIKWYEYISCELRSVIIRQGISNLAQIQVSFFEVVFDGCQRSWSMFEMCRCAGGSWARAAIYHGGGMFQFECRLSRYVDSHDKDKTSYHRRAMTGCFGIVLSMTTLKWVENHENDEYKAITLPKVTYSADLLIGVRGRKEGSKIPRKGSLLSGKMCFSWEGRDAKFFTKQL